MTKSFLIYGAGGHARVIADAIQLNGGKVVAFIDDNPIATVIDNIKVKNYDRESDKEAALVIGIGDNNIRRKIGASVGHSPAIIIHPGAVVAKDVTIGEGTVVLANAVIQTGAVVGKHVIVNANVCIDHDAVIEDYCHIYPNSYIGGGAVIRSGITIQAGSTVARNTVIETDTKN